MRKILLMTCLCLPLLSCVQPENLAPVYRYGVKDGVGSLGVHVVQGGDTVWKISQKYNLDLRGIIEANHLSPPYALINGKRLNLPAPQTYKIRGNESLYAISRLFNTTQTELARLNRLSPPYKLAQGRTLKIPNDYSDQIQTATYASPVRQMNLPAPSISTSPVITPAPVEISSLPAMPPQPSAPPQPQQQAIVSNPEPLPARTGLFLKPVSGRVISSYGEKPDGQHNDGINIQAKRGDAVRAAENGRVVYVGNEISGYGNMVLLRHGDEYMTAYAHMDKSLVKKGDTVRRGQTIGTVGSTGFVDKPQLHFEIRKGKKAVDPSGLI